MRRTYLSASMVTALLLQSPPARAEDCGDNGWYWLGTMAAFTARADESGTPGALVGNEAGISPLALRLGSERCARFGLGGKVTYDGHWRAALPIRLSLVPHGDSRARSSYLQTGPAFRMGAPGIDAELGVDWSWAALFVGATWLPGGPDRGATLVTGLRISLLAVSALIFCTLVRCYTT